jgi:hypothetical protein
MKLKKNTNRKVCNTEVLSTNSILLTKASKKTNISLSSKRGLSELNARTRQAALQTVLPTQQVYLEHLRKKYSIYD